MNIDINKTVMELVNEFSRLEEVEGILLAGSHATKTNDKNSDYDIYIYVSKGIALEKRKEITDKFFRYVELDNTFWEKEDDGILSDGNIEVEIIYRELNWIESSLDRTLLKYEADTGYTTCFWSNIINSIILYDKNGELNKLQEKYRIDYPKGLKENIVRKNYPLLKKQMPAYYNQIEKALKRDDFISINHRIAAFFASYFDIIFAINEIPHPGEKKLLKIIKDSNLKIPNHMYKNIETILKLAATSSKDILLEIDDLVNNLDILLNSEKININ
ncbi:nucleotidyltransferase [Clostridium gelidum]|uniref:Nucleotidyltransferase n=1 Tax=Clostridium gelidum TaxID=704125 RepID=A0ABM7T1L1_9CLOT|nr:nucleotidyltransferase domain-containing protein [Clostridium gelidum]BCZ45095.1 nucleotidyltransferase [Clostridium gelidum]